jgi:transcriptional regulator with XRE-family HTH domain
MSVKTPDPLDAMVGAKIRILRIDRGLRQSDLAKKIGVTYQQIQKYEKGANRVGASRLSRLAAVLGVSVGELFEAANSKRAAANSPFQLLSEPGALRVLKAYVRTSNPRVRRAIANLVEGIADKQPAAKSPVSRLVTGKRGKDRRGDSGLRA